MWMEKAQRRAVLPANGGYHILRDTFCSHLAMQGATAKAIQELAGHQDLTTTQRYIHLSPAHKDAAIRLLDRRPVEDAVLPIDFTPPAAALRSGRVEVKAVGDSLETNLRPEPESSHLK
jgi:integrase-like protein